MSYLTQTPSGINFTQGTFNHLRAFSLDQDSLFSFYLVIVLKVEMGSHYGAQGNLSYIWEQQSSCLSWSCSHASGCPGHSVLYFFTFENLVREKSSREPLAVACQLGWHVMAQRPWCPFVCLILCKGILSAKVSLLTGRPSALPPALNSQHIDLCFLDSLLKTRFKNLYPQEPWRQILSGARVQQIISQ